MTTIEIEAGVLEIFVDASLRRKPQKESRSKHPAPGGCSAAWPSRSKGWQAVYRTLGWLHCNYEAEEWAILWALRALVESDELTKTLRDDGVRKVVIVTDCGPAFRKISPIFDQPVPLYDGTWEDEVAFRVGFLRMYLELAIEQRPRTDPGIQKADGLACLASRLQKMGQDDLVRTYPQVEITGADWSPLPVAKAIPREDDGPYTGGPLPY